MSLNVMYARKKRTYLCKGKEIEKRVEEKGDVSINKTKAEAKMCTAQSV